METEAVVVAWCTAPDVVFAQRAARAWVQERLAACVQMLPGLTSVYRWQGAVHEDSEVLLIIKTVSARVPALRQWLETHHPYDVPELVVLDAADGLPAYLRWVVEQT
ncbi:MAG: divalent-cation tolerance protein CutA [Polyangiales bacterium]